MNSFEWNLRYPDASEVTGFEPPIAAGGLDDDVNGPVVVPGSYSVVLDYGGQTSKQSFNVALDPRLHESQEDLAARLELGLKIHSALDALDKKLNEAIAARDKLTAAVAQHHLAQAQASDALSALNNEIGDLVQLQIQSSEGSVLHPTKLRSHLAYLAADIDLSYLRPTKAEYAVFDQLNQEAQAGEQRLDAATAAADKLL